MLNCFVSTAKNPVPIIFVEKTQYSSWLTKQSAALKNWLEALQFRPEPGATGLVRDKNGQLTTVVICVDNLKNMWNAGGLPFALPAGQYSFKLNPKEYTAFAIAWGLGAYQFTRYKTSKLMPAQLVLPQSVDAKYIHNMIESTYLVRDLINTPTDDMGPTELAQAAAKLSRKYHARFKQIVGKNLLKNNYASIFTVGRASDDEPRLIDIRWGNPKHPRITLVGKGVCFDSGGLDIKPSSGMLLMKKDMAGGAHALGLARMIMEAKLPIYLRVLIPAVENVISGNAYRPGDIIKSRKGLTIEIGNTDAEGRVILADALTEAASEKPELIINLSTLTGAARVALGTDLPAVFSNDDVIVNDVVLHSQNVFDNVWRMPLFQPYRESLNSPIADINNNSSNDWYGGAITAALFLQEFISKDIPWLHYDMMAWNLRPRPGRPQGGEAMALRGLFSYLVMRYQ